MCVQAPTQTRLHFIVICGGFEEISVSHEVDRVIAEMGRNDMMKKIEACLSGSQIDEVNDVWIKRGNISWYEAFSVWLLLKRKVNLG
jgi:hypothetical protein